MAWRRLKNKLESFSVPSLVKLGKQLRQCALQENQYPDSWMTELEDLRLTLDELGSSIPDNQLILCIINYMTSDYTITNWNDGKTY
jgi:hypothetical protein